MKVKYQCSNCGQKYQTSAMLGVPEGMWFSGVRVVGDAVYCEDCTSTWAERNGEEFDSQYPNGRDMFVKWWNRTVDEQAKIEGKVVKVYGINEAGHYYERGMDE